MMNFQHLLYFSGLQMKLQQLFTPIQRLINEIRTLITVFLIAMIKFSILIAVFQRLVNEIRTIITRF